MSYQNENFGMMDEGYFVPRGEILSWLNDLLHLNLSKIEQLGSGAVYCQVIDVIHPGKVSLNKVNWKARNDYEFINNLKVLQNAFDKIGIKRHVQVEKLAKAKYQDNLEFIQWLKRYYDLNCGERGNNYMPEERRGNVVVDFGFAQKNVVPKTYNAGGVVKNATTLPGQKKKTVAPTTSEAPKRIKSPPGRKPVEQKKSTVAPVKKENVVSSFDHATNTSQIKKEEEDNSNKEIQQSLVKALQEATVEMERLKEQSNTYKQKSKQAEMKVEMIREIIKSEDDAIMKVTLIEQIIKD